MYDVRPPDGEGRARTPLRLATTSVTADYLTLPGTREGFGSVHDEKRSIRKWGVSNYFLGGERFGVCCSRVQVSQEELLLRHLGIGRKRSPGTYPEQNPQ